MCLPLLLSSVNRRIISVTFFLALISPMGFAQAPQSAVAPQVYVQRQDVPPQEDIQRSVQLPANYWYYCRAPAGYYPYVNNCPNGWEQVAPQPSIQQ